MKLVCPGAVSVCVCVCVLVCVSACVYNHVGSCLGLVHFLENLPQISTLYLQIESCVLWWPLFSHYQIFELSISEIVSFQ